MGIPDHLTYPLRNLYAGQEATVRTRHGTMDWFQIGKGDWYCHPVYLTYMQSTSWEMPGLDGAQAGINIVRRNINYLRNTDDITLMAESEEELKSLLMEVKEESEKAGLKLNIQKLRSWHPFHQFMTNRWVNNGNSDRLYFLGLQNHCRWWLQE